MSQRLDANTVVGRARDVSFSKLDAELLAIDADSGYCYALNESAGRVWDLLATPTSVAAVCAQLGKEYVVEPAVCLREVMAVLKGLCDDGLVRVCDRSPL